MKKIIYFTSEYYSHLVPILPILEILASKHELYCVTIKKYKDYFENKDIHIITYPENYFSKDISIEKKKMMDNIQYELDNLLPELIMNDKNMEETTRLLQEFIYKKIKLEAIKMYDFRDCNNFFLKDVINLIKPDIIFRDSLDFYTSNIAREEKIRCIGVVTNNMYNIEYLNKSKRINYANYLRLRFHKLFLNDKFFKNLPSKIQCIYNEIAEQLKMPRMLAFPNYNLNEQENLIYTIPELHPKPQLIEKEKSKFYFLNPVIKNFRIEKESTIDNSLINFIKNDSKKIAYIATGSFITKNEKFYNIWINILLKKNYKVIVSLNNNIALSINRNKNLYTGENLPQKFILKNSQLFITSGGANSIYESIYFEVPMIICPISGEQILTGVLLEDYGIAKTIEKEGEVLADINLLLEDINKNLDDIKNKLIALKKYYWSEADLKEMLGRLI